MQLLLVMILVAASGIAQTPGAGGPVDAALRETLSIAADHTIDETGVADGFWHNDSIRIPMPDYLRMMNKTLRVAGQGPQIEKFVLAMNRAAEQAAPAARSIFKEAIVKVDFHDVTGSDPRKVLKSGPTGATDYLRTKAADKMTAVFRPAVDHAMEENGVVSQYKALAGHFKAVPFAKSQKFDISAYVVMKTMDGLFYVLGLEEQKIRSDPAAQASPVMKQVFGKR